MRTNNLALKELHVYPMDEPLPRKTAVQMFNENYWWGKGFAQGFVAGAMVVAFVWVASWVLGQ